MTTIGDIYTHSIAFCQNLGVRRGFIARRKVFVGLFLKEVSLLIHSVMELACDIFRQLKAFIYQPSKKVINWRTSLGKSTLLFRLATYSLAFGVIKSKPKKCLGAHMRCSQRVEKLWGVKIETFADLKKEKNMKLAKDKEHYPHGGRSSNSLLEACEPLLQQSSLGGSSTTSWTEEIESSSYFYPMKLLKKERVSLPKGSFAFSKLQQDITGICVAADNAQEALFYPLFYEKESFISPLIEEEDKYSFSSLNQLLTHLTEQKSQKVRYPYSIWKGVCRPCFQRLTEEELSRKTTLLKKNLDFLETDCYLFYFNSQDELCLFLSNKEVDNHYRVQWKVEKGCWLEGKKKRAETLMELMQKVCRKMPLSLSVLESHLSSITPPSTDIPLSLNHPTFEQIYRLLNRGVKPPKLKTVQSPLKNKKPAPWLATQPPNLEEVAIAYAFLKLPQDRPFKETEEKTHAIRLSIHKSSALSDSQKGSLLETVNSCWQVIEMDYRSRDSDLVWQESNM